MTHNSYLLLSFSLGQMEWPSRMTNQKKGPSGTSPGRAHLLCWHCAIWLA
ncbi:hypothetical protein BN2364_2071 [Alloalcanivorax xenomutans]|nr:hypothetical protein BN2364_2071 [Alloalcanivorax xenomutans]